MRIDRNSEAERVQAVQAMRETTMGDEDSQSAAVSSSPLVNLSNEGKTVQKLREAVDSVPNVRSERVEKLKKQIQEGSLEIDTMKLALRLEALLSDE